MFGTNKTVGIHKINVNNIFALDFTMKCRYSHKKFTSLKEVETKQNQITFNLMCDIADIQVKDKVVHGKRSFIVSEVSEFDDSLGQHLEVLMLEDNSRFHEDITITSLADTQNNYDELLGEWIGPKSTTTRTIKALVDSAKLLREKFISMLDGGKIETTELVITVFYPENIAKTDKIVYNGNTYEIKWILNFSHQVNIGVNRYVKTYAD